MSILLTNALNYTPGGGAILVRTQTEMYQGEQWVGFAVSDNGPGIPLDEQPQLFTRFYRGSVGLESGIPGTGLGLALVKEIVERHQGRVEVSSSGVAGEGAVFGVWLPAAD